MFVNKYQIADVDDIEIDCRTGKAM